MGRLKLNGLLALAFTLLVGWPAGARSQNYIQSFAEGKVDWSNGIVEAVGIGEPPKNPANAAQARAVAKAASLSAAQRNLLEIVLAIRMDSRGLVRDSLNGNEALMQKVKAFVKSAQAVAVTYLPDGKVRTSVSTKLGGPFAELVLPPAIRPIDLIRKTEATSKGGDERYTGLVVDYRGFEVKPAMVPRVIDEDGNEVYGPAYVSRHYAVETGMAGYSRDFAEALTSIRVADKPLTVKGVQTSRGGPSDVMVSRADAAKIRGAASNLCFLQQCRVVFVLD